MTLQPIQIPTPEPQDVHVTIPPSQLDRFSDPIRGDILKEEYTHTLAAIASHHENAMRSTATTLALVVAGGVVFGLNHWLGVGNISDTLRTCMDLFSGAAETLGAVFSVDAFKSRKYFHIQLIGILGAPRHVNRYAKGNISQLQPNRQTP